MGRNGKFGGPLAGVSIIALSVSLGGLPAVADDYVIDTDVINVNIATDIDGSVINNAVVGNGGNDFGIKVRNDAVVSGDLINNGTVTAGFTALGDVAATSVAGIVVWSGGQVEGEVVNNGSVSASGNAIGGVAAAQGYGIVTEGDDNPIIENAEGASVSAEATAAAQYSANAIAGGLGEAAGSASLDDLIEFDDVIDPVDVSPAQSARITNEGTVEASASARIITGAELPFDNHQANALAFGVGQLIEATVADAVVTNASGADIMASASAEARFYENGNALAAAGGVAQVALGGAASGDITNQGNIDVGVSAYATSIAGEEGGAGAASLGAGSLQIISGVNTSATAEMVNDGNIGVYAGSRAVAAENTALAAAAGLGAVQVASGVTAADAGMTNTGDIAVAASATATGVDVAVALGAAAGNVQGASGAVATAEMTNSGTISAEAAAESNDAEIAVSGVIGAGSIQAALGALSAQAEMTNSGGIDMITSANASGQNAIAGVDGLGNAQVAVALDAEGISVAELTNEGSITTDNFAEAVGTEVGVAVAISGGSLQVAAGGGNATALATNESIIEATAAAEASGPIGVAVGAGYGNAQAALAIGEASVSSASLTNNGSITTNNTADAQGTNIAVGAANSVGNIQVAAGGGNATAMVDNTGDIDVTAEAAAAGAIAVAAAGSYGAGQAALAIGTESVAAAHFTNDGTVAVSGSIEAEGSLFGAAVGIGSGSRQLAVSGAGSTVEMVNAGLIDLETSAIATVTSEIGSALAAVGGAGVAQASLSLVGPATSSLTNSGSVEVSKSASASGGAAGVSEGIALGTIQIAGSYANDGSAVLVNNDGASIEARVESEASGLSNVTADSYVIGAGQIAVSGEADAVAQISNVSSIVSQALSNGFADSETGFVLSEADAAAVNQLGLSGGGVANLSVSNSSSIEAAATANASASSALAGARAQGINQYGLANTAQQSVNNSGEITVKAEATSNGVYAGALARSYGVVQAPLTGMAGVTLDNSGDILAEANATASGSEVGDTGAFAIGHMVRQPLELLIPITPPTVVPDVLPDELDPFAIMANAAPADLPVDFTSLTGGYDIPGAEAASAIEPQVPDAVTTLDISNDQDATITVFSRAEAATAGTAFAAGGWYEAQLGGLSGVIDNHGIILANAVADGSTGTANAFGVAEIVSTSNDAELTNSGVIVAFAVGQNASATGVSVASFAPILMDLAVEAVPATAVIDNLGGAIVAAESTDAGVTITRGDAISTRGGYRSFSGEVEVVESSNAVEINLQGGGAATRGKDVALEAGFLSSVVQAALSPESGVGYIYGNIQISEDDVINVSNGVTVFDGVVNAGSETGVGAFNLTDGGQFMMVLNQANGAAAVNVAEFNMNSTGTLVYELNADSGAGDYGQVSAITANINGGKIRAVFNSDIYADTTVYHDVISADTLVDDNMISASALNGAPRVRVRDNSLLLDVTAVDDGGNGIDLNVERVAFNNVSGLTANQKAAAGGIEKIYGRVRERSDFGRMVSNLFILDRGDYKDVKAQLSGAEYAQHLQSVLWSTRAVNRIVSERMECADGPAYVKTSNAAQVGDASVVPVADAPAGSAGCFNPGQGSVWARGFGQWNSLDGDSNAPGYDEDQFGFMFGADYAFHDHMFLGIAGGYFNSNGNFDDWAGRDGAAMNYDGLQLAAYGGYDNSVYYLRGVASYGNYDGDASRTVDIPGGRRVSLSGDPSSDTWSFYGETGYRFGLGTVGSLTPFAGLSLATATLDGFTEDQSEGNAAALEVHDSDGNSVASVLGARFEADMSMGSGVFTPSLAVSWMHEFDNTAQEVDMSFAGAPSGADFTIKGSSVARDSMLVDAGAKFSFNDAMDLGLFYNGQFNADYTSNAVTARIGYKF